MMEKLTKLLTKKPQKGVKIFCYQKNGWGDAIYSEDGYFVMFGKSPSVGDLILWPLSSGETGILEITKVKRQTDPRDMVFCEYKLTGYEEDGDLNNYKIKKKQEGVHFL